MSNIDLIVTKILDEAEILKFDSNRMFDEAIFFAVDKIYYIKSRLWLLFIMIRCRYGKRFCNE